MLTPDELNVLPGPAVKLWQQVEDDILKDAGQRIGQIRDVSSTAAWKLWRLKQTTAVRTNTVKLLAKYSGTSEAVIREILQNACTQALNADDADYIAAGWLRRMPTETRSSCSCSTPDIGKLPGCGTTSQRLRRAMSRVSSETLWIVPGCR